MSITDELRSFTKDPLLGYASQSQHIERLTAIADRIDAAHEEALGSKVTEALLANEDGTEFLAIPASKMAERYVELPVDADGEYIHIGDVMEPKGNGLLFGETSFEVRSMRCDECGWEVYDRLGDRHAPSLLRHHHAPTVEDVLREMLDKWGEMPSNMTNEAIVAEYAAKLRLAGGDE